MVSSTVVWLVCGPALTATFIGLLIAFLLERDDPALYFSLMGAAILVLLLRLRLSAPGARARLLSGNAPYGCFNAPRTPEEFADNLLQVWRATARRPTVVGSGWGFFIGRVSAHNAVFTHKLKGSRGSDFTFFAGTELRTVQAELRKKYNLAFWSTPTMQRISIGSWLARSCHGNQGPLGQPSNFAATWVRVVDLESPKTAEKGLQWMEYENAKHEFDQDPGRFVIAEVVLDRKRMSADDYLQKARCDVEPSPYPNTASQGLLEWLTDKAVLRVLFFGSSRKNMAIGATWVWFNRKEHTVPKRHQCDFFGPLVPHVDPHTCSVAGTSFQLDTCSLLCGYYEKSKNGWKGIIRLSDANAFSPDPSWLGFPLVALLSTTVNFELMFVLAFDVSKMHQVEVRIQRLCDTIFGVFNQIWGRSEIRCGKLSDGLIFLDCVMQPWNAHVMIRAIEPHVHARAVALHDSKYQGKEVTDAIAQVGYTKKTPRVLFGAAH